MSAGPLPQRIDLRKALARGDCYQGVLDTSQLPQMADVLDPENPAVEMGICFSRDAWGQAVADVSLQAPVLLQCQRCLAPLREKLASRSRLGLVTDDEQARHLRADYEPWIAIDEIDLWDVAAEEFALALPLVAYHPAGVCAAPMGQAPEKPLTPLAPRRVDHPFAILSTLLAGDGTEEK